MKQKRFRCCHCAQSNGSACGEKQFQYTDSFHLSLNDLFKTLNLQRPVRNISMFPFYGGGNWDLRRKKDWPPKITQQWQSQNLELSFLSPGSTQISVMWRGGRSLNQRFSIPELQILSNYKLCNFGQVTFPCFTSLICEIMGLEWMTHKIPPSSKVI